MIGLIIGKIRQKTEEISDVTELGKFFNMPVRTYSSGMQLQLAFAVYTRVQSDIIIMDEWLSDCDAVFMAKVSDRVQKLVDKVAILVHYCPVV